MFELAILKLAGWYLGIIMVISLVASVIFYQVNNAQIADQLQTFQDQLIAEGQLPPQDIPVILRAQSDQIALQLLQNLLYINGVVLITAGAGAYLLARKTLQPLARAHEVQSRFTSDASHELRTPLATMKLDLEVALRERSPRPAATRRLLKSNLEEVNKLIDLSEMLLSLSKLQDDRLEMERFNLVEATHQALQRFSPQQERIMVMTPHSLYLHANPAGVGEVVGILVENALKYSPADSPVTLQLSRKLRRVLVAVSSSGPKIPADKLAHIFERFYRADSARTAGGGHGLGLAIAKRIIDLHDGDITVNSHDGLNTFVVTLPSSIKNTTP